MAYDDFGPDFEDDYQDEYLGDIGEDEDEGDFEDDGQPSEYDEWQDYMGGDDNPLDYYDPYDGDFDYDGGY